MKLMTAALALALMGGMVQAGVIEKACNKSDRKAANRTVCGCIQDIADITLTRGDQKLAAKFFKDPHMAQVIRQSDRASHETFWQKYKLFGQTAETYCG